jgi:4-hydroxythreonine-4-phosphate dehydrogenase
MIAITAGDPCGIGPELLLKALVHPPIARSVRCVVIGDRVAFAAAAKRLRRRVPDWTVIGSADELDSARGRIILLDCKAPRALPPGRPSADAGRRSLRYLEHAVRLWRDGRIRALVTAPVTKWAIARVAPSFVGQTEYLASATGTREVVMLFVSDRLRVALLTRHVPLGRVPSTVTPGLLRSSLRLTAAALTRQFHIASPRLALCGINPHAGESGRCGEEERRIITPVLRQLRREGLRCDGPFAADGFFAAPHRYDAVVCPYHDQGLIPFKMVARDRGCQLSVGLPLVRTSPDHGSALDIAGKGMADPGSMRYAIRLADRLSRKSGVRPQSENSPIGV